MTEDVTNDTAKTSEPAEKIKAEEEMTKMMNRKCRCYRVIRKCDTIQCIKRIAPILTKVFYHPGAISHKMFYSRSRIIQTTQTLEREFFMQLVKPYCFGDKFVRRAG